MTIRCPGCHATVELQGDLIERHHQPQWEQYKTVAQSDPLVALGFDLKEPMPAGDVVIELRAECGMSGARVRVKT